MDQETLERRALMQASMPLWKPCSLDEQSYGRDPLVAAALQKQFGVQFTPTTKALDSTAVGPLIRQDLDPVLYRAFVKSFPFFEMVEAEPANGEFHAYNRITDPGDASFIGETDDVIPSAGTFVRDSVPVAILATQRGISLKAGFSVTAGGAGYNAEAEEIMNAAIALRRKAQKGMLRYNASNNAATTETDPDGLFDVNSLNGMRYILTHLSPAANTIAVDGTQAFQAGHTPITDAFKTAVEALIDAGGDPTLAFTATKAAGLVDREQTQFARYTNDQGTEIVPGLKVKSIEAGADHLVPFYRVPGDGVGTYVVTAGMAGTAGSPYATTGAGTYQDIFVGDMGVLRRPYLGGPAPTLLELPIGANNKLQKLFIPFIMFGLSCKVPAWWARVAVKIA